MDKEKEVNSNQESSNKSQAVVEWLLGEYQIVNTNLCRMYLINQYGRLGILEFWNLEYYAIFFCLLFTGKVNFNLMY